MPGLRRAGRHALRHGGGRPSSAWCGAPIAVFGIGCYTAFSNNLDVEVLQALHGRAPSLATGVKRARPDTVVLTVQGDGDMVNEGLQEVLHTAARGENVTCIMLNNGVFGETGGHMTATTVLGQRTKTSLEGRDADRHGRPDPAQPLLAEHRRRRLRGPGRGQHRRQRGPHQEACCCGALEVQRARRRVLVRRDPHHVPDRMVRRDRGGARSTWTTTWPPCTPPAC